MLPELLPLSHTRLLVLLRETVHGPQHLYLADLLDAGHRKGRCSRIPFILGYRTTTLSGREISADWGLAVFEPDRDDLPSGTGRVQALYLQTSVRF